MCMLRDCVEHMYEYIHMSHYFLNVQQKNQLFLSLFLFLSLSMYVCR